MKIELPSMLTATIERGDPPPIPTWAVATFAGKLRSLFVDGCRNYPHCDPRNCATHGSARPAG